MSIELSPPPTNTKYPHNNKNSENENVNETEMIDPFESYHRRVAYVETIKVVNNHYSILVTLKFSTVTKEKTVNIAQKHIIIFAVIKLLNPTADIKYQQIIVY